MSDSEQKLAELRRQIDAIDEKLLALVNERAEVARRVAGMKSDGTYYRPDREAQVLRRLVAANSGPLPDDALARLFQEIMSACRAVQKTMTVAFLGPEGTFTEAAAFKHFGHAIDVAPQESIDAVFREVESEAADYGVVPVENSTEGAVNHTLDMFLRSTLSICGEVELRIHHCLMSRPGERGAIRRVFSHQQSLAQCRHWLDVNLPGVPCEAVASNAEAARRAAAEEGAAAIAGEVAAEIYGLGLVARNVEDDPDNTTRFLVIGRHGVRPSGSDKTSVLFSARSARDRPGALFDLLAAFKRHGVNMTRIESRPSRAGVWDYVFFVDFEGHAQDEIPARALAEIAEQATVFRVLGSYPRAASE